MTPMVRAVEHPLEALMARTAPAPDSTPEPASRAPEVCVELAHFLDHEGVSYVPGATLTVSKALAESWIWAGYAKAAPEESDPQ